MLPPDSLHPQPPGLARASSATAQHVIVFSGAVAADDVLAPCDVVGLPASALEVIQLARPDLVTQKPRAPRTGVSCPVGVAVGAAANEPGPGASD